MQSILKSIKNTTTYTQVIRPDKLRIRNCSKGSLVVKLRGRYIFPSIKNCRKKLHLLRFTYNLQPKRRHSLFDKKYSCRWTTKIWWIKMNDFRSIFLRAFLKPLKNKQKWVFKIRTRIRIFVKYGLFCTVFWLTFSK